jgi:DNA-binding beta-propeller fold protein YncE
MVEGTIRQLKAWAGVAALCATFASAQDAPPSTKQGQRQPVAQQGQRTDVQIEMDVVRALDASAALKSDLIAAATVRGEVTLSGTVSNDASKELAESIATRVDGVTKIHDNLTIGTPDAEAQGFGPALEQDSGKVPIEIENWTKPKAGWLYVLDPRLDSGGRGGRIYLVDPETAKVMGNIDAGGNADFALSPDGSYLYVASVESGDSSELAVIDTADGMITERATVKDRVVFDGLPPFSTMAVSSDGLALRILIDTTTASSDADSFLLATFDTQTGNFLYGGVNLGNCGPGRFIAYRSADQFDFLCPRTNAVRLISVDGDSDELRNLEVKLPWERRVGAAEAIEVHSAQDIVIVRGDGGVMKMNAATQRFTNTLARPDLPDRVPPAAWPSSPDGSRVYLGYRKYYDGTYDNRFYLDYGRPPNQRPSTATADEFRVLDAFTLQQIGTIKTKKPFWSAATGNDGRMLYAMAPGDHSILVIDTMKLHQIRALKVGGTPALALVAP